MAIIDQSSFQIKNDQFEISQILSLILLKFQKNEALYMSTNLINHTDLEFRKIDETTSISQENEINCGKNYTLTIMHNSYSKNEKNNFSNVLYIKAQLKKNENERKILKEQTPMLSKFFIKDQNISDYKFVFSKITDKNYDIRAPKIIAQAKQFEKDNFYNIVKSLIYVDRITNRNNKYNNKYPTSSISSLLKINPKIIFQQTGYQKFFNMLESCIKLCTQNKSNFYKNIRHNSTQLILKNNLSYGNLCNLSMFNTCELFKKYKYVFHPGFQIMSNYLESFNQIDDIFFKVQRTEFQNV